MGFLFICKNRTQAECFKKRLFGDTARSKEEVLSIKKGDSPGFLYNVESRKLFGIFEAVSDGGYNLDPTAWNGIFPWQVKVEWKKEYPPVDGVTLENARLSHITYKRILTEREDQRLLRLFEAYAPVKKANDLELWLGKRFLELRQGLSDWREFEVRIRDIFGILGFDARLLGHEIVGPFPDIVLYPPPEIKRYGFDFWIVVDCKNSTRYYITEDDSRAMISYIEEHRKEAINEGVDPRKSHFIFVALGFRDIGRCRKKIEEIQGKTGSNGALLGIDQLLLLMLRALKLGRLNITRFPDLLRVDEITEQDIDAIFPET